VLAVALSVCVSTQAGYAPARYRGGAVPSIPVGSTAVGGGEVLLELDVSREGRVARVRTLRTTPSFTEQMMEAVRSWRFNPADVPVDPGSPNRRDRRPVDSKVLLAGVFRPPALLGPTLGEPIENVAGASAEVALPTETVMPPLPPTAFSAGVVLVEVQLDATGAVAAASVVSSAPAFDSAALDAARQWKFRPARRSGAPVPAFVYIMFGFAVPSFQ
jgi:TonB family protein